MALENVKESVTLTAESKLEDEVIATLNSRVPNDGVSSGINLSIRNKELYDKNKKVVRKDQSEFQNLVWDTEDRLEEQAAEE